MNLDELTTYLDDYLHVADIQDYGIQGLQVETDNKTVRKIALAVDTAPAVIEAAANWNADMLIVHHGILWGKSEPIRGAFGARVRLCIQHGINLYGAHLPLDAHQEVGNNAVLGEMFNLKKLDWWCMPKGVPLGVIGMLSEPQSLDQFTQSVNEKLDTNAVVVHGGGETVERLAIISGYAAKYAAEAKSLGADTFMTGETDHTSYWLAADLGINLIFAGHYATETVGVKALGAHLTEKFGVESKFFDFPTGM